MSIGVNLSLKEIGDARKLSKCDFVEISDFIFPQHILNKDKQKLLREIAHSGEYSIRCLEGPIRDIKPESGDPEVYEITNKRFRSLIEIASDCDVNYVLFNTTFDPLVKFDFYTDMWLENNMRFWEEIIPFAESKHVTCLYCNVWDDVPDYLLSLFSHINSKNFKFGFDVGHHNYISRVPADAWISKLRAYLEYICIHDNNGDRDDHLSLGLGNIDFEKIIDSVRLNKITPDYCLQLFDKTDAQKSVDAFSEILENRA